MNKLGFIGDMLLSVNRFGLLAIGYRVSTIGVILLMGSIINNYYGEQELVKYVYVRSVAQILTEILTFGFAQIVYMDISKKNMYADKLEIFQHFFVFGCFGIIIFSIMCLLNNFNVINVLIVDLAVTLLYGFSYGVLNYCLWVYRGIGKWDYIIIYCIVIPTILTIICTLFFISILSFHLLLVIMVLPPFVAIVPLILRNKFTSRFPSMFSIKIFNKFIYNLKNQYLIVLNNIVLILLVQIDIVLLPFLSNNYTGPNILGLRIKNIFYSSLFFSDFSSSNQINKLLYLNKKFEAYSHYKKVLRSTFYLFVIFSPLFYGITYILIITIYGEGFLTVMNVVLLYAIFFAVINLLGPGNILLMYTGNVNQSLSISIIFILIFCALILYISPNEFYYYVLLHSLWLLTYYFALRKINKLNFRLD